MEIMSSEEVKIRGEIQMDVERSLEEEIKEGICSLALKLHRLYQQQTEREARDLSNFDATARNHAKGNLTNSKILSEVNISIKMEGGTKIEIKEIKKPFRQNRLITSPKIDQHAQRIMAAPPPTKKFDWAKSLRSGPSSRIDCHRQASMISNGTIAKTNPSQQRKLNTGRVNNTVMELGWRE